MLTGKPTKVENLLLNQLQYGPQIITGLIEKLKKAHPKLTKQGVYTALRKLQKQEVITTHNGSVSLNALWLSRAEQFIVSAQRHYQKPKIVTGHFATLQEGERVQYTFSNPIAADVFWNHALTIVADVTPLNEPFVAYNPHCWFFIAHTESERQLARHFNKKQRQYLITVGSNTPLDQAIKKEFDGIQRQYYMRDEPLYPQKPYYYLNIVGDFVMEVWMDRTIAGTLEKFYKQMTAPTQEVQAQLRQMMSTRGKTKLVISRNEKKATARKKTLLKTFYVPSSSRW
jgi:hypothetical protein